MTKEKVLSNLKEMIGTEFDENEIICVFEDFEEESQTEVIVRSREILGMMRWLILIQKIQLSFYLT